MVQVGGATAVAAAMRERLEIINTQSQIEEIQSNLWNRNGQSQAATNSEQPAAAEPATSGKKSSFRIVNILFPIDYERLTRFYDGAFYCLRI